MKKITNYFWNIHYSLDLEKILFSPIALREAKIVHVNNFGIFECNRVKYFNHIMGWMDVSPCFSAIIKKVNNFSELLFDFLDNHALPKWGLLLKERICSCKSKFFLLKAGPTLRRQQKMNMAELLPEKVGLFTLMRSFLFGRYAPEHPDMLTTLGLLYMQVSTLELQWLEHCWLVCHGCFKLVLESLGKKSKSCRFGIIYCDFLLYIENHILYVLIRIASIRRF